MLNVSSRHGGLWETPSETFPAYISHRLKPNLSIHRPRRKKKKIDFFCSPMTSPSVQRRQLRFQDTFSTCFFFSQLPSESLVRPPAADKIFHKTTASGASLSPPQRRPPPCSARSIARVFIRNVMCGVGRSSSLRL